MDEITDQNTDVNLHIIIKNMSDDALITSLEKLVHSERKITYQILAHINEVDARMLYAKYGYKSLLDYLIKKFNYCESSAYRRMDAAKLLSVVPSLGAKLQSGALKLTQLNQVQKCLKYENKKGETVPKENIEALLNKLEDKSGFSSLRILAEEFSQPVQRYEVIKPQQDGSVKMELVFSEEDFELLKEVKSLMSHICHDGTWKSVIVALAKKCKKEKLGKASPPSAKTPKTPIEIAQCKSAKQKIESSAKAARTTETVASAHPTNAMKKTTAPRKPMPKKSQARKRPYIPIKIKRKLLAEARHQCEFFHPESGKRCDSKHQLEIDHIQPLAFGGSHQESNLRILCRLHNNYRN